MLKLYLTTKHLARKIGSERGQDVVEYAIMIGIMALAAVASVSTISGYVTSVFGGYAGTL
jgi:Flp pilus assembly pilin Flp